MSDSLTNKITMACTVIMTAVIIWQQATGVPASWITYVAALVIGFGFGYSLRYFIGERKTKKAAFAAETETNETIRRRIEGLDSESERLLAGLYLHGALEVGWDSRENVILKGLAGKGLAAGGDGGTVKTWYMTERCRRVVEEDEMSH